MPRARARARAIGGPAPRPSNADRSLTMFRLIMLPSNAVCDILGLEDEHERGMVRMLVNTLLWLAVPITVLTIVWVA
jgi:hypothetical protein